MEQKTRKDRRSLAFRVLLAGFFLVITAGSARIIESISNWYWYNFAGLQPGPLYLAITGGLWMMVGLIALVWLWFRLNKHRAVGLGAALFVAISYWLDRLLVRDTETSLRNTSFVFILTLFILLFVIMVLRPWNGFRWPKG